MKKFYFLALLGLLTAGLAQAQQNYSVSQSDYSAIRMTLTAPVPSVETVSYLDVDYNVLQMSGFAETKNVGMPSLPQFGHMLEIPLCDGLTVKATNARYDTIDGAAIGLSETIMPVQAPRRKSDTSPYTLTMNRTTYTTDAYYGEELVTVERIGVARNQNLAVLHFAPVQYNPVSNKLVVCRSVDVTVTYVNADQAATENMQELHYSPAFAAAATMNTLPRKEAAYTGAPIRMLVVAGSTFSGNTNLTNYINWKKRKGFMIDVVYTSDANVGTTTTSIASYLKSQYDNATTETPAPTFVLLVGDAASSVSSNATPTGALVPAFTTQLSSSDGTMSGNTNEHPTDLYYFTWTSGDNLPDCYYGRFSARTATDLQNIIEKTLTYEQYTFSDPSYLNTSIVISGVDNGSTSDNAYGISDPTQDYVVYHYVNGDSPYPFNSVSYYKNRTSRYPAGASTLPTNVTMATNGGSSCTQSATIRTKYNTGAGWINYSAHGDTNEWYCPELTSTQANSMTNTGKYGVMIGNCCLTNTFTRPSCFGETLLRKSNAGAVAYIGASDYSYWNQDFYWSVGYRSSISYSMSLDINSTYPGSYDLMCHTHSENFSTWHTSLGSMIMAGNNAVQTGGSSGGYNFPQYYWEIYHLMGDPSITPWLTTPDDMTVSVASTITAGTTELAVTAVPYAYVAMTTGSGSYNLVAAAFANASGVATLTLPSSLAVGTYEVAASAQQYKTAFATVSVIVPSGPYVMANSLTEDNTLYVGQSSTYSLELENVGTETASNITISFASDNDHVTVTSGNYSLASLNASATQTLNGVFSVQADASCTDQMPVTLTATISWTGCETPAVVTLNTVVNAPLPVVSYTWNPTQVSPGGSAVCNVTMTNQGHMAMDNVTMSFTEDFPLVEVSGGPYTFNLAVGGTVNYSFTATVDAQMPDNVTIPFTLNVANDSYTYNEEVRLLVSGASAVEDFNDNDVTDWTGGTYPWYCDNSKYHSASYSMRSYNGLSANRTSEMSYTWTSTVDDSVRFYYLTSARNNSYLYLYIDGVQTAQIAGTGSTQTTWTRVAYPVSAGTHVYKFAFTRGGGPGGNSVSNAAWVDDIEFPSNATDLIIARTDQVCQNGSYTLNGENVNTSTEGVQYLVEEFTTGTGNLVELNVVGTIESAPITVEACNSYEWNGTTYNTSSTYSYTTTSAAGCDSVATLNLTILPNYTITFNANGGTGTMDDLQVCSGQSTTLTVNAFTNGTATFTGWATSSDGEVVYENGASVTPTGNMTLFAVWYEQCTDLTAVITMSACDTYTWFGQTYSTTGTYTHTVENAVNGECDSIYTLNLTINQSPDVAITGNVAITEGQSTTLTASGAATYTWSTGETSATITVSPSTSTNYTVVGRSAEGCETTTSTTVTVSVAGTSFGEESATACDEYLWHGTTYTASGDYSYTIAGGNSLGADSVVTLHLTINQSTSTTVSETACDSYTWSANGQTYTVGGSYSITGTNADGCPDVQTLNLTINNSTSSNTTQVACDEYVWDANGQTYTVSGTYTNSGTNANGCPDEQTLVLTINHGSSNDVSQTACDTYTWSLNGVTYTQSGDYTLTDVNASTGCPDINTLHLTINNSTASSIDYAACDSYDWNGQNYTQSGTYSVTGTNAAGCPDVQTLNLTINRSTNTTVAESACDSYTWTVNGQTYATSGTYSVNGTNAAGCPEVQNLILTINHSTSSTEMQDVCDSYVWYGTTYTTSGTYQPTSTDVNGCDNQVTLNLTVRHSSSSVDVVEVCDSYTWRNGNTYTTSTNLPTYTTTNSEGCSETITLDLTVHYSTVSRINAQVNVGEAYGDNGFYVEPQQNAGMYRDTLNFQTTYGCDSTVVLNLVVLEVNGIDDVATVKTSIYPNPTAGVVTISIDGIDNATVELLDLYGRRLERSELTGSTTAIDLSPYASGIYFVRIYKDNTLVGTSKIVRE